MSRRKCFYCCEGSLPMFTLPKEESVRQQWIMFIYTDLPLDYNPNIHICSSHFTEDCFVNRAQYEAGFSVRLLLKDGAVPTLLGRAVASGAEASTSQQDSKPGFTSRYTHVGCQTDRLPTASIATQTSKSLSQTVSVGTQLSAGRLREHFRSKATQVNVCFKSDDRADTKLQASSTPGETCEPLKGCRRAKKRPRLDLQEEETTTPLLHDSTSELEESDTETSQDSTSPHDEPKYIVFESCLREVFNTCPLCKTLCDVERRRLGTFVSFSQWCPDCRFSRRWQSQPVTGSTPVGNLQMSAAVYFTGASFFQLQKICRAVNLQIFQFDTFRKHVRMFLQPAVLHKWRKDQQMLIQQLQQEEKMAVRGHMKKHSTGESDTYSSYTLMHLDRNTIIDIQLLQSSDAAGRLHRWEEGLRRSLDLLEENHLTVDHIVTDHHQPVQRLLKDRNITQYYDVTHLEKGLSKKLVKASKNKECLLVNKWLQSIQNHMYWTAASSASAAERTAKWKSLINHIQNVHTHHDPNFPKCEHPDRKSRDSSKWFTPGSMALCKVEKLLVNKRVLRVVEKLSRHLQTSVSEVFHRTVLRFTPKKVFFPFIEMLCRLYLAAMYYNENTERERVTMCEEDEFLKSKNKESTTETTNNYVSELMRLVLDEVLQDPARFTGEVQRIHIPDGLRVLTVRSPQGRK